MQNNLKPSYELKKITRGYIIIIKINTIKGMGATILNFPQKLEFWKQRNLNYFECFLFLSWTFSGFPFLCFCMCPALLITQDSVGLALEPIESPPITMITFALYQTYCCLLTFFIPFFFHSPSLSIFLMLLFHSSHSYILPLPSHRPPSLPCKNLSCSDQ